MSDDLSALVAEARRSPSLAIVEGFAGGGRYDELLRVIGAPHPIPAVGAAIYTDRLLLAAAGSTP